MKKVHYQIIALIPLVILVNFALAQELMIYPAKGQSAEQLERDKFECYSWAKKQTGFDPMQVPKATEPPPPQSTSRASAGRGAVGGAAVGLAVGSTQGKAGKGAAIGAATGGVVGGMRRSSARQSQQQAEQEWAQQQAQNYANQRSQYDRAYSVCLEGRGYTVR